MKDAPSLLDGLLQLAAALLPGMLGAAVGQAWKPGLSWRQRLIQWCVGVSCQYYVSIAIEHGLGWHRFVAQGLGFFVAVAAFDVAPKLVSALAETAAGLPAIFRQAIADFIGRWSNKPPATGE